MKTTSVSPKEKGFNIGTRKKTLTAAQGRKKFLRKGENRDEGRRRFGRRKVLVQKTKPRAEREK